MILYINISSGTAITSHIACGLGVGVQAVQLRVSGEGRASCVGKTAARLRTNNCGRTFDTLNKDMHISFIFRDMYMTYISIIFVTVRYVVYIRNQRKTIGRYVIIYLRDTRCISTFYRSTVGHEIRPLRALALPSPLTLSSAQTSAAQEYTLYRGDRLVRGCRFGKKIYYIFYSS